LAVRFDFPDFNGVVDVIHTQVRDVIVPFSLPKVRNFEGLCGKCQYVQVRFELFVEITFHA
jgi:hypothetical protein